MSINLRTLHNNLNASLKQRSWKIMGWVGGQPEPELRVGVLGADNLLPDGGQVRKPRGQ